MTGGGPLAVQGMAKRSQLKNRQKAVFCSVKLEISPVRILAYGKKGAKIVPQLSKTGTSASGESSAHPARWCPERGSAKPDRYSGDPGDCKHWPTIRDF